MVDFSKLNSEEFREEQHQMERVRKEREAQAKKTLFINGPARQDMPFESMTSEEGKRLSKVIGGILEDSSKRGITHFCFVANSGFNMIAFIEALKLKQKIPSITTSLIDAYDKSVKYWIKEDQDFLAMWKKSVDNYIGIDTLAKLAGWEGYANSIKPSQLIADYLQNHAETLLLVRYDLENFSLSEYLAYKLMYSGKSMLTINMRFNNYVDHRYL